MTISCPTCKLVNSEDEQNCRRCFTPLVVTVKGGAASKTYSRRLIDYAKGGSRFSWLRIVAGCVLLTIFGFAVHRAAQRFGKEEPRVAVSAPQTARFLRATVRYQNRRILITNNDSYDWILPELLLSTGNVGEAPHAWKYILERVNARETAIIELSSFRDEQGASLDPAQAVLRDLKINCRVGDSDSGTAVSFR